MKSHIKLTDGAVRTLPLASGAKDRIFIYDLGLTGLMLQVTRFKKSWYIYKSFRHKPLKYKLGDFPVMGADEARSEAIRVLAAMAKDIHPQEARRKSENAVYTLGELFDRYLAEHLKPHTRGWEEADKSFIRHCGDLAKVELSHLIRNDLQRWIVKMGETSGRQSADRTFNIVRACLRWGMKQELYTPKSDPTQFIKLFNVKSSPLHLDQEGWGRLKSVLEHKPSRVSDIIHLLVYTAARKGNVLAMEWKEIHLSSKLWTVPAHKSKSGKPLFIPLLDESIEILEKLAFATGKTGFVFPSRDSASGHFENIDCPFREIREEAQIGKITIHGLRHTTASWMGMTGANAFEIQRQLGHSSVSMTMKYVELHHDGVRKALSKAIHSLQRKEAHKQDEQSA